MSDKIPATQLKNGMFLRINGEILRVVSNRHAKPGKGPAYMCVEFKRLDDGKKKDERFSSSDHLEIVHIKIITYHVLYKIKEGGVEQFVLMHPETCAQINVNTSVAGSGAIFILDGMDIGAVCDGEIVVGLMPPEQVELSVRETEQTIKGQTATGGYKPAILENGLRVNVPQHINSGDQIILNTETHEYVRKI